MILHADCLDAFRSVRGLASIVTDAPCEDVAALTRKARVLVKDRWIPYMAERFLVAREATESGSWGLFWTSPKTIHWTACALDDAGWELVRPIEHVFSQGWNLVSSQLKPAHESWWLVRWGGATPLQLDRCRVRRSWGTSADHITGSSPSDLLLSHTLDCRQTGFRMVRAHGAILPGNKSEKRRVYGGDGMEGRGLWEPYGTNGVEHTPSWECFAACSCGATVLLPTGTSLGTCSCGRARWWACAVAELDHQHEDGAASRFFQVFCYSAKASKHERQAGCERLLWVRDREAVGGWRQVGGHTGVPAVDCGYGNVHVTIKPVGCEELDGLMRWLVRLVTPEGESVGDPFCGSGSTALAADMEGHGFVGCDIDPGAVTIAKARRTYWARQRLVKKAGEVAALAKALGQSWRRV